MFLLFAFFEDLIDWCLKALGWILAFVLFGFFLIIPFVIFHFTLRVTAFCSPNRYYKSRIKSFFLLREDHSSYILLSQELWYRSKLLSIIVAIAATWWAFICTKLSLLFFFGWGEQPSFERLFLHWW